VLEGQVSINRRVVLVSVVVPHLLRETSPLRKHAQSSNGEVAPYANEWSRCYATALAALDRLLTDPSALGSTLVPPAAILQLQQCRVDDFSATLDDLILRSATSERLAELACSDSSAARSAAVLLETLETREVIARLADAFGKAAVTAAAGERGVVTE